MLNRNYPKVFSSRNKRRKQKYGCRILMTICTFHINRINMLFVTRITRQLWNSTQAQHKCIIKRRIRCHLIHTRIAQCAPTKHISEIYIIDKWNPTNRPQIFSQPFFLSLCHYLISNNPRAFKIDWMNQMPCWLTIYFLLWRNPLDICLAFVPLSRILFRQKHSWLTYKMHRTWIFRIGDYSWTCSNALFQNFKLLFCRKRRNVMLKKWKWLKIV